MLRYFPSREEADRASRVGLSHLLRHHFKTKFTQLNKYCKVALSGPSAQWFTKASGGPAAAREAILDFIVNSLIGEAPPRGLNRDGYETLLARLEQKNIIDTGRKIIDMILLRLRQRRETADLLDKYRRLARQSGSYDETLFEDLYTQLERTIAQDFLVRFSLMDLERSERYLKSLAIRCERAYNNPSKDLEKRSKLKVYEQNIEHFRDKVNELSPDCKDKFDIYTQMVAELRISLFSPELKTILSVSEKKLARAWEELISGC